MKKVSTFIAASAVATLMNFGFTPSFMSLSVAEAAACPKGTTLSEGRCKPVNDTNYRGTGGKAANVQVKVCLPKDILRDIKRADGTYDWVVHLVYTPYKSYERVRTVRNQPCYTQWVSPGTQVAVYVTCSYTGWITTGSIVSGGNKSMSRVNWTFPYKTR